MRLAKLDAFIHHGLCYLQQHQLWWWITPQQNLDISVWLADRTPLAIHLDGTRLWIRLPLLNQAGARKGSPGFLHRVLLWPLNLWGAALEWVRWRKVVFIKIWTHTLRNERNKEHEILDALWRRYCDASSETTCLIHHLFPLCSEAGTWRGRVSMSFNRNVWDKSSVFYELKQFVLHRKWNKKCKLSPCSHTQTCMHEGVKMRLHCDGQEADERLQKHDRQRSYGMGRWWDVTGTITTPRLKTLQ